MTNPDDNRVRRIVAEETKPLSPIGCVVLLIAGTLTFVLFIGINMAERFQQRITTLEQQVKELQQR